MGVVATQLGARIIIIILLTTNHLFYWPFHNPFPFLRTAPLRLRLYGGLMSAEDKHLIYHIINILFTKKQI